MYDDHCEEYHGARRLDDVVDDLLNPRSYVQQYIGLQISGKHFDVACIAGGMIAERLHCSRGVGRNEQRALHIAVEFELSGWSRARAKSSHTVTKPPESLTAHPLSL